MGAGTDRGGASGGAAMVGGDTSARRILIVEDEPAIAELLAEILADEGYRVTVTVGEAALAEARDDPPALVLLDVMMPGMDGPTVCRHLKADARTARVPVIFLTALPAQVLAARLGDCAHEGLLGKPFDFDELLAAVRQHLP